MTRGARGSDAGNAGNAGTLLDSFRFPYCAMVERAEYSIGPVHGARAINRTEPKDTAMEWKNIQRKMRPGRTVGTESKPEAYRVTECTEKSLTMERVETGKTVKISRRMVEKTLARLEAGETIPRRGISYTVAIESAVLVCLGRAVDDSVVTVGGVRGYALRI